MTLLNRSGNRHNRYQLNTGVDMTTQQQDYSALSAQAEKREKRAVKRVVPIKYQLVGWLINQLARINRDWASNTLLQMWFTVFKRKPRAWVNAFWRDADYCINVHLSDKCIPVYLWGQGPLVVLMHGWSGSGTQYRYFIPRLCAAGFQVAAFDAPAHGSHPGKQANVLDFADTLVAIQQQIGAINSVIAHSLGSMAAVLATHRGLKPGCMVLLAPHLDVATMVNSYAETMNISPGLASMLREKAISHIQKIFKIENAWDLLTPRMLLEGQYINGMLMFDSEDEEISQAHFNEIESVWQPQEVLKTSGLGHFRIFKDHQLIDRVVGFLQSP
jgi:hypothetical protein